jgi:DNA-directed RNA polymerase specialized sigma24 family protein
MSTSQSISLCIDMLKRGDRAAAEKLWDAYMRRLVGLARARMGGTPRRAADEEDVALSAFDSFYRRAETGQFARLSDRDDLWQILVLITERKAIDLIRREGRKSRGEGKVLSLSEIEVEGAVAVEAVDPGPTPEFAAQVADEFRHLLERLGDDSLRTVAVAKMRGDTNKQVAERLGCIEQTVERKLRSIRQIWSKGDLS